MTQLKTLHSPTLANLPSTSFDVVIVGGGIVGAGIFRDLSLHGIRTLLIDKKDFSSQTSHKSSKMLHGGIRYLENMDFDLVHEALHEKNIWIKLAPHLTYPSPFFLPVYQDFKRPLWQVRIGLQLYDLLSQHQNPPHQVYNKIQSLLKIPELRPQGLKGCGMYYDAVVDDARLCLENIYDARNNYDQAYALNYVELVKLHSNPNHHHLCLRDNLEQTTKEITTKNIIFAVGPFTDQLLGQLQAFPWRPVLLPSKGSHIWIRPEKLPLSYPVVLTTQDNRVIFVIPQPGKVLVGTTEIPIEGNFFDLNPTAAELDYLIENLAFYFPKQNITKSDILSSFAGVRPLVKDAHATQLGKTSREHKIFRPGESTYVIVGGKYTTFRTMGQAITREICLKQGTSYNSNLTIAPLTQHSCFLPFKPLELSVENIQNAINQEFVRTLEDLLERRMGLSNINHWPLQSMEFQQFLKLLPHHLVEAAFTSGYLTQFQMQ